ncbi:ANTAR domain-containing protein [Streptomyces sp. AF1A]|uniref:ANTAR domain-containing protein n=1 Tax=Streptomyces sp. AF1A TaxID=3394350 RepID=UPI0039BD552A
MRAHFADQDIGEAMGTLTDSHHLIEDQAVDVLRRFSREHSVELREAARRIRGRGGPDQPFTGRSYDPRTPQGCVPPPASRSTGPP